MQRLLKNHKKIFLLFLALYASLTSLYGDAAYTTIPDTTTIPILTPSLADRKVEKIVLSNGLQAYLVSDPKLDQSGAALSVEVGSWSDPANHLGMAHFCEHMLFLGTEKYPEEDSYQSFIEQHGGKTNAFTASDATTYGFSVNNDSLAEALDRFAQFFIQPLFNTSGVNREMHAVDQEFALYIENDAWRAHWIENSQSNPDHPESRFSVGTLQTLQGISQAELKNWYETHYSANLMHLVVYSTLPMDQLRNTVIQDFGAIPNRQLSALEPQASLFKKSAEPSIIYLQPVQNILELTLSWQVPATLLDDKSQPTKIVAALLGHEGPGSLLAYLKQAGLAESLATSMDRLSPSTAVFTLDITLTTEGTKQLFSVIQSCFNTIAMLKAQGVPRYFFDEEQMIAKLAYVYQSRQEVFNAALMEAYLLTQHKLADYPATLMIPSNYSPEEYQQFLAILSPANCQITVVADPHLTGVKPTQQEPWSGAQYALQAVPQATYNAWNQAQPIAAICLPAPNPFVPKTIPTPPPIAKEYVFPHCDKVVDESSGVLYAAQDTIYGVPEIFWAFQIKTPQIVPGDAKSIVLSDLYVRVVNENLNPTAYLARLGGLFYELALDKGNLMLTIHGYPEKALLYFQNIAAALKKPTASAEEFAIYKDSLLKSYTNASKETPLRQGFQELQSILFKEHVSPDQRATALSTVTHEEFQNFTQNIYSSSYLSGVLYGMLSANESSNIWTEAKKTLLTTAYPLAAQPARQVLLLPATEGPFLLEKKVAQRGNATILLIQGEPYSFKTRAAHQVLSAGLEVPFYSTLRTQQQTGYQVFTRGQEAERQLFNTFAVLSDFYEPDNLLLRFDLFLNSYLQNFSSTQMPPAMFEVLRTAAKTDLQRPPENLSAMGARLALLVFEYDADFDWFDKRIQGLDALTYEEMVAFAQHTLSKENRKRLALLIQGETPLEKQFRYTPVDSIAKLQSIVSYTTYKNPPRNP